MDFELNEDQRLLQALVDRYVADNYSFEQRRRRLGETDAAGWGELSELGLTALRVPADDGGLGAGGVELMLVGEAFGRALLIEPYLPSAVLAPAALQGLPAGMRRRWSEAMLAGEIFAVALAPELQVAQGPVTGEARLVLGADAADWLVLVGADGLAVVAADAEGLQRRGYRLHGGGGAADLTLAGAPPEALVPLDCAALRRTSEAVTQAGVAFVAAEVVGVGQAVLDLTLEHLRTRQQFGRPLAANQALQHRAAEMLVELEQARSAAMLAALMLDDADAAERAKCMAAAKIVAGQAARFLGQQAIQLHGGIGVTEEYAVGHYFKRLTAIELLFGDGERHAEALAALGGFVDGRPYWDAA